MAADLISELFECLAPAEQSRLLYLRQAFRMLPPLRRPRILDAGCGRGEPTLELARLSDGLVVGLDIDAAALRDAAARISGAALAGGVALVRGSLATMPFVDGALDLIWAEGSIFAIGLAKGLAQWRPLLAPGGFLVVHEAVWLRPDPPPDILEHWSRIFPEIGAVEDSLRLVEACGYEMVGYFALPEDAWWRMYYAPLQARIDALRAKHRADPRALAMLDEEQRGVDLFRRSQYWYGSAYFVARKAARGA